MKKLVLGLVVTLSVCGCQRPTERAVTRLQDAITEYVNSGYRDQITALSYEYKEVYDEWCLDKSPDNELHKNLLREKLKQLMVENGELYREIEGLETLFKCRYHISPDTLAIMAPFYNEKEKYETRSFFFIAGL